MDIWTVRKILAWSKTYFEKWELETPMLDAQLLLGHVLGMSKIQLMINGERPLDKDELARYKQLIQRRTKLHEPLAYILGSREFWSLDLNVTPDVLIPRPDTECIVERVLEFARARLKNEKPSWLLDKKDDISYEAVDECRAYYENAETASYIEDHAEQWIAFKDCHAGMDVDEAAAAFVAAAGQDNAENTVKKDETDANLKTSDSPEAGNPDVPHSLNIVDIGTGSGAIALALACELDAASCTISAVDISADALNIARKNAEKLGFGGRIHFALGDLLDPIEGNFDIIVSNPPYITDEEMKTLMPEVKCEPKLALEAGADGLDIYRRLVPQARDRLNAGGLLIVEIGSKQSENVENLFRKSGFKVIQTFSDYAHLPRIVAGVA